MSDYTFTSVCKCPVCGEKTDCEVTADISGGYRRATMWEPSESPDIDILAVSINGRDVTEDVDTDQFKDLAEDSWATEQAERRADAAERRADEMRDR